MQGRAAVIITSSTEGGEPWHAECSSQGSDRA